MSKPFFPVDGRPVVPLLRVDAEEEITQVRTRKVKVLSQAPKVRLFQIGLASIFKLTIVVVDGENVEVNGLDAHRTKT
jgi:hypothetical protein